MERREAFLADFVPAFREVDAADRGILSPSQVALLIYHLSEAGGDDAEVDANTTMLDLESARDQAKEAFRARPRAQYTFSECVELMSELIAVSGGVRRDPGTFDASRIVHSMEADNDALADSPDFAMF
mmetsp:Transcript_59206/g.171628  ORF Transcript_59206/g.171628 Transcript_59206/m.171628 type:complete len:128 (+) Transcript_59206:596-979(+)